MKTNRRAAKRQASRKRPPATDIGGRVVQSMPAALFDALAWLPTDLDWGTVSDLVVPVFARRRATPHEAAEPVRILLPPGLLTGFAIDIGPAILHVGEELLASWPVGREELVARALHNLARMTRRVRPRDLVHGELDGIPVRVLESGAGWAATLVLLRDELFRIFGAGPQRLIAPMRDLLISLPETVPLDTLDWLSEELARADPNALALESFLVDGSRISCVPIRPVEAHA